MRSYGSWTAERLASNIPLVQWKGLGLRRNIVNGSVKMSLSRPLAEASLIGCEFCTQTFAHQSNLDLHLQTNTGCRLKRAVIGLKRRREQGLPDPQPIHVERRPLNDTGLDLDDDAIALEDDEPEVNQQPNFTSDDEEEPVLEDKVWDSTEQFVAWIKRAGLSQRQTDDMINLFRDTRMSVREALQTIESHRDVDRYLMGQIVGEVRKCDSFCGQCPTSLPRLMIVPNKWRVQTCWMQLVQVIP